MVGGPSMGGAPARTAATGQQRDGAQGGAGMSDALAAIADRLQLDATQRAAFDQSLQAMRERLQQMRSAGRRKWIGADGRRCHPAPQGPVVDDRSKRMAERMKQNFSAFRATLKPAQQATWDAELAALDQRQARDGLPTGRRQARSGDRAHRRQRRHPQRVGRQRTGRGRPGDHRRAPVQNAMSSPRR